VLLLLRGHSPGTHAKHGRSQALLPRGAEPCIKAVGLTWARVIDVSRGLTPFPQLGTDTFSAVPRETRPTFQTDKATSPCGKGLCPLTPSPGGLTCRRK